MTETSAETSDLKVVISIREGIVTVGIQKPGDTDPHFESLGHMELGEALDRVLGVYENATARWSEDPRYPAQDGATPAPTPAAQPEPDPAEAEHKQASLF